MDSKTRRGLWGKSIPAVECCLRFKISAAVICFLVIVAASVTAYAVAQYGREPHTTSTLEGIDSALVGAWQSVGAVENVEWQLRFQFGADGWYSRQYFKDDAGILETTKDNIKSNNPSDGDWKYVFKSADSLVLSEGNNPSAFAKILTSVHGNYTDFKRVGVSEYPNDLLIGKWKTSVLINGANFEWTIEIGREQNYHSHIEARDEGRFTAAGGTWMMITSNWSTSPIPGSYQILSPASLRFNIYPFDSITLHRCGGTCSGS